MSTNQYKIFSKLVQGEKMRYNEIIEDLKKLTPKKITDREMMKALGLKTPSAITYKKNNNSYITDEEIGKIEDYFLVDLTETNNCIKLDYYPEVFGSCGNGSIVFCETPEKIEVTKSLIHNYSAARKYSVINARGSSMAPLIKNDDCLIVQKYEGEQIIDDDVYVFRYNGELFVKRLAKNIDQILIMSENKQFENRVITPKENNFEILGKIVGLFRTKI